MSLPYPQDRHRERKEKGGQPYEDAKQALRTSESELQTDAEAYGEERQDETDEERAIRVQVEARARLRAVGEELRHEAGLGDEATV